MKNKKNYFSVEAANATPSDDTDDRNRYYIPPVASGHPTMVSIRLYSDDEIDANIPSYQIPTISSRDLEREANDVLPSYHEVVTIEDLPTYHEVMNGFRHDNNSGIVR
jgi:hypothetical protein